ncbi:protein ACCELERATED CELL DEATH 6-like [Malania oleifera]|uniref:protein ACCELERATED CELL DEATH 6-like n=1 Tax=Malania oleifera TaxID=397392 RepID=UPI0025AE3DAD|nr:protein ACCELERATED CELL DEATH 6-like [Malania oleifera]
MVFIPQREPHCKNVIHAPSFLGSDLIIVGFTCQFLILRTALQRPHSDISCAEQLLDKQPDLITQEDEFRRTALHYAATDQSSSEFTKWLLEKDAGLAYKGDAKGLTPLHLAAGISAMENIRAILDFCPDSVESLDRDGRHPLHLAAASGKLGSVRELLKIPEMRSLLNRTDENGSTPLHLAIQNKHFPVIKELLETKWVDASAESKKGISFSGLCESDPEFRIYVDKNFLLLSFLHQKAPQQRQKPIVWENLCGEKTTESHKSKSEEILKGYLKQRANSLSVVAALLTTIAFAAAFTIPGGFKNNPPHPGHAVLGKQAVLHIFVFADTLAVCFAILVVFLLIWEQEDDITVLDRRIRCSVELLLAALCGTLMAFMSGLYAVISAEALWLAILICTIGSDPFLEDLSNFGWRSDHCSLPLVNNCWFVVSEIVLSLVEKGDEGKAERENYPVLLFGNGL